MAFVSLRQVLDHAAEHGYGVPVKEVQRGIAKARLETFGCAGHASRIKPAALEAVATRYPG
jgi:hypothetical protein